MSLVGTRPILQDELQKYELHHRARIAIKPGITGMWQVSGRSDITDFEEVVRLDTEYMEKYLDEKHGRVKETEHTAETVIESGQKPSAVTADRRAEQEPVSVSQSQPQKAEPASRAKVIPSVAVM